MAQHYVYMLTADSETRLVRDAAYGYDTIDYGPGVLYPDRASAEVARENAIEAWESDGCDAGHYWIDRVPLIVIAHEDAGAYAAILAEMTAAPAPGSIVPPGALRAAQEWYRGAAESHRRQSAALAGASSATHTHALIGAALAAEASKVPANYPL